MFQANDKRHPNYINWSSTGAFPVVDVFVSWGAFKINYLKVSWKIMPYKSSVIFKKTYHPVPSEYNSCLFCL